MDMKTIIKNSVGENVTNKINNDLAFISGVEDGEKGFKVYVSLNDQIEVLSFSEFVLKYHLEFTL